MAEEGYRGGLAINVGGVWFSDLPSGIVVHGGFQVLHQRSAAPDIQRLHAVANAEDRLAHVIGILQKKLVGVVAKNVSIGRLRMASGSVLLGINVCRAAWQEHAVAGLGLVRNFFRGGS